MKTDMQQMAASLAQTFCETTHTRNYKLSRDMDCEFAAYTKALEINKRAREVKSAEAKTASNR